MSRQGYFDAVYSHDVFKLNDLLRSEVALNSNRDVIDALRRAVECGLADLVDVFLAARPFGQRKRAS